MNNKTGKFMQNSQLKSLQKETSVYATIRVTSSQKFKSKNFKINAV